MGPRVSILDGARERDTFAGEGGRTGARFERAILADGAPVVIKHACHDDWIPTATGGITLGRLWDTGVFDRVPAPIDHTMLAVEPAPDGVTIVMRDVSDAVLAEGRVLSRDENRRVLGALDRMHVEFWGEDVGGATLEAHYAVFTSATIEAALGYDTPIPGLVKRGWELFPDLAPRDVSEAMLAIVDDPAPLVSALAARPSTFIHGDLRLHNLGMTDDAIVVLDWEAAGNAPASVEFAWYLIISASRIDASREQVIEDYREIAGDRFDPRAWDLACIGALMWLGWNKAVDIVDNADPAIRAVERADLDWWIARVRSALEVWSPG